MAVTTHGGFCAHETMTHPNVEWAGGGKPGINMQNCEMFSVEIIRAVGGGPEEKRRCPELTRGIGVRRRADFAPLVSKGSVKTYEFNRHLLVSLAPHTHSLLASNVLFFDSEGSSHAKYLQVCVCHSLRKSPLNLASSAATRACLLYSSNCAFFAVS